MQSDSSATPKFHVENILNGTKVFPHHDSVSELWQKRWRGPCSRNQYPFYQGSVEDFDPIFERLVAMSGDDNSILHDPDAYASAFLPAGDALYHDAEVFEKEHNLEKAKEYAANDTQRSMLEEYSRSFKLGSLEAHKESQKYAVYGTHNWFP